MRIVNRQIGPGMVQRIQTKCSACNGTGQIIPPGFKCSTCKGNKTVTNTKLLEVYIRKGMKHGEKLVYEEEGNQYPGTNPGDVIIVLQQQPHPFFRRSADGPHLVMTKHISLAEALTGFSFQVTHLDGRKIKIQSDDNETYQPNDIKAILEEGMPVDKAHGVRGHLYIELKIDFPKPGDLSLKNRQALLKLLPGPGPENKSTYDYAPKKENKFEEEDMSDEPEVRVLESIDLKAEKKKYAQAMRDVQDEDDDDDQMEGVRVQGCNQQ